MTQIITEVVLDLGHIDKKEKRVFAKGLYEDFLRTNKNPNTSIHAGLTADVGGNKVEINHLASLGIHVKLNQDDPSGSGL